MKLKSIYEKIFRLANYVFMRLPFESDETDFIRHNRLLWSKKRSGKREVLVENYAVSSCVIAQSYAVNALADKYDAKIIAYNIFGSSFLRWIYNLRPHAIYKSFGAEKCIYVDPTTKQGLEAKALTESVFPKIKSKQDVEDLRVEGIWIGDLVYDSYLLNNRKPTIDLTDPNFKSTLEDAICHYVYWRDYLKTHDVAALIVSHCVYYPNATILRIAVEREIPCYQVSPNYGYYLNKKYIRAHNEFKLLPEEFRKLPLETQKAGLEWAEQRLDLRFKGVVGVDMYYSTKSAYGKIKSNRLLNDNNKFKVLIAPHCFFDSPHSYGNNLFTDFYEWLNFIGRVAKKTDHEFYIKNHPDVLPENDPIIKQLLKEYPNFIQLPKDSSHIQIIQEGIGAVLTVFGTIAGEYAALGLPVINASLNNPHYGYNFNIHVSDKDEYERLLINIDKLKIDIDKKQAYEFYFMWYKHRPETWLFRDYHKFVTDIGGYNNQVKPVAYRYFLNEFTKDRHKVIRDTINRFIDSKDYFMVDRHLQRSSSRNTEAVKEL